MAPIFPHLTARFRFHYTMGGIDHTLQVRSAASPSVIGDVVHDFLTALGPTLNAVTHLSTDWAPIASNVFNPVLTGHEGTTYGAGVPTDSSRAFAFNFIGRTTGGRRVRIMVFGAKVLATDYRYGSGEAPDLDAARDVLVAAGSLILGIDGGTPVWKNYVNVMSNAYWQKELRG